MTRPPSSPRRPANPTVPPPLFSHPHPLIPSLPLSRFVLLCLSLLLSLLLSPSLSQAHLGEPTVSEIGDAITELDVLRAQKLLAGVSQDSAGLALERARLSLYVGDCDAASATLATLNGVRDAAPLAELAKNCARATAGSLIVEDAARGLWIRLQDGDDRVLVPLLSEVAVKARSAIERDLGVIMPRPLRIDLVRDLFSLSAVSGLPLRAAETTGTVAVARWGRVNMISPRAALGGFPWEDTMAHEITHLAVTRATRDNAPLWLQEGLAKRQEIRWRAPRPFDGQPPADDIAREAYLTGQSIGIDHIGPSIAMLPSADAASIAFAEVSSFVEYLISESGRSALMLLFADLKGLGTENASAALKSVSGYDLTEWVTRWHARLDSDAAHRQPGAEPNAQNDEALRALTEHSMLVGSRDRARRVRSAELLYLRGEPALASQRLRGALASDPSDPTVRFRLGRSLVAEGKPDDAAPLFASPDGLAMSYAGWFAFQGRYRRASSDLNAKESFDIAKALDPYLEDAACEGAFRIPEATGGAREAPLPADPATRALCEAARKIQRD